MDIYTISKLVAEALITTLIHGTLLFFMIKGFIKPKVKWLYVFIVLLIILELFAFAIYPVDIFEHPIFPLFQVVCFLGALSSAIKYYWQQRRKRKQMPNHL